jgi:hypothetical protein
MRSVLIAALSICLGATAYANPILDIVGHQGDGSVQADVPVNPLDATLPSLRVGSGGDDERGHAAVFFFELPNLQTGDSLLAADLSLRYLGFTPFTFPQYVPHDDADLYGLGVRPTVEIFSQDYYDGDPSGALDTLIRASILTPGSSVGVQALGPGGRNNLLAFIQNSYRSDGTPTDRFAVFRINMAVDVLTDSGELFGYELATGDSDGPLRPHLTLTVAAVPEPPSIVIFLFGVVLCCICAPRIRKRSIAW